MDEGQFREMRAKVLAAAQEPLPGEHPEFEEFARGSLLMFFNQAAGERGLHARTA